MADEATANETTRTRRLRKDPRRGLSVSIPKQIAERLPDDAEVELTLREVDGWSSWFASR
jgi:hypothetical protein